MVSMWENGRRSCDTSGAQPGWLRPRTAQRRALTGAMFSKIARISSADAAVPRRSRTRAVVEKFRDGRQRAQVRLELILRHDEKDDEFHRRVVERVELDAGASERPNAATTFSTRSDEACGMAMPKPMPVLIVSSRCRSAASTTSRSLRFDLPLRDEQIDQFDDGRPPFRGFHLRDDLIDRE